MSADLSDQATDREMADTALALRLHQQRAAATPKLAPQGHCLNPTCGEDFDGDPLKLFCGKECAAEHGRRTGGR